MSQFISSATIRNWERLHVFDMQSKLTRRANKTNSKKTILPLEYVSDCSCIAILEELIDVAKESKCNINDLMYSIILKEFELNGLMKNGLSTQNNVKNFINEYSNCNIVSLVDSCSLPRNEIDSLGLIYETIYAEGEKNKKGMYYTPAWISHEAISNLDFENGQLLFDPCCGSGSFLLAADSAKPNQLFGIDSDPIAVMICKANLILKFRGYEFEPQIYCDDFLSHEIIKEQYDYILTNPPWGATIDKSFSETYSLGINETFVSFVVKSLKSLKQNGILEFLLPESVLNVKTYAPLRKHLITNYCVESIKIYPNLFTGVTTKFISLRIRNTKQKNCIEIMSNKKKQSLSIDVVNRSCNFVFSQISNDDECIINKLYEKECYSLKDSIWALGIVTGNNAKKIFDTPKDGTEPIYTGKEIGSYKLLPAKKYVIYDRSQFQQVAKDEIYRAGEKLAYKFISSKPVFAYDNKKSLFLNSANILIPNIPDMSIKAVLLFLNSELFQFAYMKKFGEIKILKGNLCELPFPDLNAAENEKFIKIVDRILCGDNTAIESAQHEIYKFYGIDTAQRDYIRKVLNNGKVTK
jgi:hypothetical protein